MQPEIETSAAELAEHFGISAADARTVLSVAADLPEGSVEGVVRECVERDELPLEALRRRAREQRLRAAGLRERNEAVREQLEATLARLEALQARHWESTRRLASAPSAEGAALVSTAAPARAAPRPAPSLRRLPSAGAYVLAIAAVAAGVAASAALRDVMGGATFGPLFVALVLVTWLGGTGPSLLALVLAVVFSRYFVSAPVESFSVHGSDAARWISFTIMSTAVVAVGAVVRRGREREARARRSEHAARLELSALQRVTARLATARDRAAVADVVLGEGRALVEADAAALFTIDRERDALVLQAAAGYRRTVLERLEELPLDAPVPAATAARTLEPVLLQSVRGHQPRFPAVADEVNGTGRAEAALPLVSNRQLVGVITLSFAAEREFGDAEMQRLAAFTALCADALDRAAAQESDHAIATTLQHSLLPLRLPRLDGFELAVAYVPAAGADVGGDWYDATISRSGRLVVSVGDVCGKGVAAAALMGRLRIAAKVYAFEDHRCAEVVTRLDRLGESIPEMDFTTLVVVSIDPRTGEAEVCRAGHVPPLLLPAGRAPSYILGGAGVPLGVRAARATREATSLRLDPGDSLLLYSDGLVERRDTALDDALERLRARLARPSRRRAGAQTLVDLAIEILGERAARRHDDVAVLALRRRP